MNLLLNIAEGALFVAAWMGVMVGLVKVLWPGLLRRPEVRPRDGRDRDIPHVG